MRTAGGLLLVAVLLATASPPAESADGTCAQRGRTVLANAQVRVYLHREIYYGCAHRRGRSFALGSKHFDCISSSGCGGVVEVRVAGRFVAYTEHENSGGADQTNTGSIRVLDLVRGRYGHQHFVGSFGHDAEVGGFRVTPSGAVGYLVDRSPSIRSRDPDRVLEIWRMDSRGRRRLDRGWRIGRASLRLDGTRFSWLHGGKRRRGSLRG